MNTKIKKGWFSLVELMVVIAMLGILAAIGISKVQAADTFQPNYWKTDTNATPVTVTNAQGKTLSGYKFPVRQGKGVSMFVKVVSTNTTALSVTVGNDVTYDGTNGTTKQPITFTAPGNFSGTNTFWTNFPPAFLSNVRTIQATTISNNTAAGATPGSNSLTATITWSEDNQQ